MNTSQTSIQVKNNHDPDEPSYIDMSMGMVNVNEEKKLFRRRKRKILKEDHPSSTNLNGSEVCCSDNESQSPAQKITDKEKSESGAEVEAFLKR